MEVQGGTRQALVEPRTALTAPSTELNGSGLARGRGPVAWCGDGLAPACPQWPVARPREGSPRKSGTGQRRDETADTGRPVRHPARADVRPTAARKNQGNPRRPTGCFAEYLGHADPA